MKAAPFLLFLAGLPLLTAARPTRSPPIQPIAEALGVTVEDAAHLEAHEREVAHRAGSRLLSLCPDCRLGTIDEDGPCGWARVNRTVIKNAVKAGHDEESIVSAYVATYGPDVLATDTNQGLAAASWIIPYLMIALGLALVMMIGRRSRQRAVQPATTVRRDAAYTALQNELADLD